MLVFLLWPLLFVYSTFSLSGSQDNAILADIAPEGVQLHVDRFIRQRVSDDAIVSHLATRCIMHDEK